MFSLFIDLTSLSIHSSLPIPQTKHSFRNNNPLFLSILSNNILQFKIGFNFRTSLLEAMRKPIQSLILNDLQQFMYTVKRILPYVIDLLQSRIRNGWLVVIARWHFSSWNLDIVIRQILVDPDYRKWVLTEHDHTFGGFNRSDDGNQGI